MIHITLCSLSSVHRIRGTLVHVCQTQGQMRCCHNQANFLNIIEATFSHKKNEIKFNFTLFKLVTKGQQRAWMCEVAVTH